MKMAKLQKATLDPTKISGRCGRLKCCLRYEYDTYNEYQKELPPIGSEIVTGQGRARVLNHEILTRQLLVQAEDGRRLMIDASEVLSVLSRGTPNRKRRDDRSRRSGDEPSRNDNDPKQTDRQSKRTSRNRSGESTQETSAKDTKRPDADAAPPAQSESRKDDKTDNSVGNDDANGNDKRQDGAE